MKMLTLIKVWIVRHRVLVVVASILFLASFLRFAQAGTFDIYQDNALNSVRAIGWFDYLITDSQTTPVQWFETPPAWAKLSFHDAPPLVFKIQNIFFSVFGDTAFILRLPYILAGIILTLVIFFVLHRWRGLWLGAVGATVFAISSYSVWTALAGNLEGMQYLFVFSSFVFFWRFFETEKRSDLFWGSFFLGLGLLSKYTTIFLILAIVLYLLLFKRDFFVKRSFLRNIAVGIFTVVLVLTPVIIYNALVYQERGHFDAALSSMVGMHPEDFKSIAGRSIEMDIGGNALKTWQILYENHSAPFVFLLASAFAFLLVRVVRGKGDMLERFLVLTVLSLLALFVFLPPETRFLSLIVPFEAVIVAIAGFHAWSYMQVKSWNSYRIFASFVFGAVLAVELLYSINTNVLITPWGSSGIFYSSNRLEARGYHELEAFVRNLLPSPLSRYEPYTLADFRTQTSEQTKGKPIFIHDGLADWQGWFWHIQRLRIYHKVPFVSVITLARRDDPGRFVREFAKAGGAGVYFIQTISPKIIDRIVADLAVNRQNVEQIIIRLDALDTPYSEIRNREGDVVFRIYRLGGEEYPYETVFSDLAK